MRSLRLLTLLALSLPGAALAGLTVSPVVIDRPGKTGDNTLEFVLANPSEHPMKVTLSAVPLVHDEKGAPREGPATYRYDLSRQIRFETPELVLAPRRWKRLRAHVELPARSGGGYAMIYARGTQADLPPGAVTAALRVGVLVELTFPDAGRAALAIEDVAVERGAFKVSVRNQGDSHTVPTGKIALKDRSGREVWHGAIAGAKIFPELVRVLDAPAPPKGLAQGQYFAEVVLDGPTPTRLERRVAVIGDDLLIERKATASRGK